MYPRGEQAMESLRLSDAHVKDDEDEDLESGLRLEDTIPDKSRRRQSSPKKRKIEHESSLVFEVLAWLFFRFRLTCSWAPMLLERWIFGRKRVTAQS